MAFPYTRILCPMDFDENSLAAFDQAVEIARHFEGTLILLPSDGRKCAKLSRIFDSSAENT